MTMLRLKPIARMVVVETFRDAANVAAGALIFGQALSDRSYSLPLAILGVCVWGILFGLAITFASREDRP